jgi:quercetin dioxygenase-like cupin family protein
MTLAPDATLIPKIVDTLNFPAKPVAMDGVKDATIREVITERDGAPNFAMRIFEVAPEGHTPLHFHPYEHEIYILGGSGEMQTSEGPKPIKAGDAIYVQADALHQFRNTGSDTLKFICLIPKLHNCAK